MPAGSSTGSATRSDADGRWTALFLLTAVVAAAAVFALDMGRLRRIRALHEALAPLGRMSSVGRLKPGSEAVRTFSTRIRAVATNCGAGEIDGWCRCFEGLALLLDGKNEDAWGHMREAAGLLEGQDFSSLIRLVEGLERRAGDETVFAELCPPAHSLDEFSSMLAAWFMVCDGDGGAASPYLRRSRRLRDSCPTWSYLAALRECRAHRYSRALEHLHRARGLTACGASDTTRTYGFELDPYSIRLSLGDDGLEWKADGWRTPAQALIPYGTFKARRRREMMELLAGVNHSLGRFNRCLYWAEIAEKTDTAAPIARWERELLDELLYPEAYAARVYAACRRYGLEPALVFAVMREESRFDPAARSHAGALGVMQLTPYTARWICAQRRMRYSPSLLANPDDNIDLGCWFLNHLIGLYGRSPEHYEWCIAAYNCGIKTADRWRRRWMRRRRPRDITPFLRYKETREYVVKVRASYLKYKALLEERRHRNSADVRSLR